LDPDQEDLYADVEWGEAAHGVLAPALEGFSSTPQFPEIGEAIEFMASIKATGAQS